MKKAVYNENCVIYWPTREGGLAVIIVLSAVAIAFIAVSVGTLISSTSYGEQLGSIGCVLVAIAVYIVVLGVIYERMSAKITITHTGVSYSNHFAKTEKQIQWADVSAVYFCQEYWFGRKTCRIHMNHAKGRNCRKDDSCDWILPVCSVDEKVLLQFIPGNLWRNDPRYNW